MEKLKELMPYVIILLVVVLIRSFIVTPVRVDGSSMVPNLHDREILILKKYDKSYHRFDIVVIKEGKDRLVKRVIGLPGETIMYKNNHLFINGKKIDLKDYDFDTEDFTLEDIGYEKVPKDAYFVLGDNRYNSKDSRYFGPVLKEDITGTTNLRVWPLKKLGHVN